ncbi:hypothetical protein CB0940_02062 [Cercospora beticola]|uniref:Uncharacterized protein n=1 Tax=Cercospora beticola TaxID=122368 RepID=A0A2G5I6H4_CERBT|nr:hypothetical protein CB0940_02062 [Cercospora beticola]XP_023458088.1 hypothetical protein CB0940_02062 [Cercospora beticola]PIB00426.1 hypothetical protein CB0940_02062 [Cercospora beticola]PIB00427.1 hypothetical protein CB0940_02062 [Cercospora beticola]
MFRLAAEISPGPARQEICKMTEARTEFIGSKCIIFQLQIEIWIHVNDIATISSQLIGIRFLLNSTLLNRFWLRARNPLPPPLLALPLQDRHRKHTAQKDQASHQTSARGSPQTLQHIRIPKWPYKSPRGPNAVDEGPDTCAVLYMTVHSICCRHSSNDLGADGCDCDADDGRHIPMTLLGLLKADAKDDDADHAKCEANVRQPETMLSRRCPVSQPLGFMIHPEVAQTSADLLADDTSDNDAQELQADLLSIESEFRHKELRDFHCKQNTAEAEDDRVRDCRNDDGRIFE